MDRCSKFAIGDKSQKKCKTPFHTVLILADHERNVSKFSVVNPEWLLLDGTVRNVHWQLSWSFGDQRQPKTKLWQSQIEDHILKMWLLLWSMSTNQPFRRTQNDTEYITDRHDVWCKNKIKPGWHTLMTFFYFHKLFYSAAHNLTFSNGYCIVRLKFIISIFIYDNVYKTQSLLSYSLKLPLPRTKEHFTV